MVGADVCFDNSHHASNGCAYPLFYAVPREIILRINRVLQESLIKGAMQWKTTGRQLWKHAKKHYMISVISITLGLAFIFYLWNVFLAQFTMQNSVSDKPWLVSNSLGCDFRAYSLSPYANVPAKQGHREDANIWLLQTHRTVTYTSEILSNPKCLGARLADGATTNFDLVILIYDVNRKKVIYRIRKYTN